MKQNLKLTILSIVLASSTLVPLLAAPLTPGDRDYFAGYEKIRAALAADDLAGAQEAAKVLPSEGAALAQSESLEAARASFAKLSAKAERLAKGQPDYYVVHCPMAKGLGPDLGSGFQSVLWKSHVQVRRAEEAGK